MHTLLSVTGAVGCCQTEAGVATETALAGIRQIIYFDEILDTMYYIDRKILYKLRERTLDSLTATPSGCRFCHTWEHLLTAAFATLLASSLVSATHRKPE